MSIAVPSRRRLIAAGIALASAIGLTATTVTNADAAGLLPTTTTLSIAQSANQYVGDPATFTATVKILGLPGLGVTPTGSVAFTAVGDHGPVSLGSAPLGSCLLTTCTASLTSTALPLGSSTVSAVYGGDTVAASSTGAKSAFTVARPIIPTQSNPYSQTCQANQTCQTPYLYSAAGSNATGVQITASTSPTPNTITAFYDNPLPCSVPNAGAVINFTETSTTATKDVYYTVNGTAGYNGFYWTGNPNNGQNYGHVCYASPTQFTGYYPSGNWTLTTADYANYGPVPYNSAAGGYVGILPDCSNNGNVAPCVSSEYLAVNYGSEYYQLQVHISTPPGDPRTGN